MLRLRIIHVSKRMPWTRLIFVTTVVPFEHCIETPKTQNFSQQIFLTPVLLTLVQ